MKFILKAGNRDFEKGLGTSLWHSNLFFWRKSFDLFKKITSLLLYPFVLTSHQNLLRAAHHKHIGIDVSWFSLMFMCTKSKICLPSLIISNFIFSFRITFVFNIVVMILMLMWHRVIPMCPSSLFFWWMNQKCTKQFMTTISFIFLFLCSLRLRYFFW